MPGSFPEPDRGEGPKRTLQYDLCCATERSLPSSSCLTDAVHPLAAARLRRSFSAIEEWTPQKRPCLVPNVMHIHYQTNSSSLQQISIADLQTRRRIDVVKRRKCTPSSQPRPTTHHPKHRRTKTGTAVQRLTKPRASRFSSSVIAKLGGLAVRVQESNARSSQLGT